MVYTDPFEIINKQVLPAFRKELVKYIEKKMKDSEITKLLEITPVALYYYKKGLRGNNFSFTSKEKEMIRKIAEEFTHKKDIFVVKRGFKKIVDELFSNKRICNVCGKENCNC